VHREAAPLLARIGFSARGIVYLLIGGFTAAAALRADHPPRGLTDSMATVARWPFGGVLILAIGIGLGCFAGWLAIEGATRCVAARDYRKRLLAIGQLGDAALYAGLVVILLGLALGWHVGGEPALHNWVAWLFGQPFGRALVGLAGVALMAGGGGLVGWAWTRDIAVPLAMSPQEKELTRPVSRYGVTGRGVALVLIGVYLVVAAVDAKPNEAHELGGVLRHLRHTSYGWIALLLFALAFGASAFFDFLAALYRRIEPPPG